MDPVAISVASGFLVIVGRWAKQAQATTVLPGNKDPNAVSFKLAGAAIFYVMGIIALEAANDRLAAGFATLVFISALLEYGVPIAQGLGVLPGKNS